MTTPALSVLLEELRQKYAAWSKRPGHNFEIFRAALFDAWPQLDAALRQAEQDREDVLGQLAGANSKIQRMLAKQEHIEHLNEDDSPGGLDEIVSFGSIHVERMADDHVWASLAGHSFDFFAVKGAHGLKVHWAAQDPEDLRRAAPPPKGTP